MEEVPSWSGVFWTATKKDGSKVGVMSVHIDDERLHKPPPGWALDAIVLNEDEDSESYVYHRAADKNGEH